MDAAGHGRRASGLGRSYDRGLWSVAGGPRIGRLKTKAEERAGRGSRATDHGKEGAVAQLGERLICIQEVAGSIPTSSTRNGGPWPVVSSELTRRAELCVRTTGIGPRVWACSS